MNPLFLQDLFKFSTIRGVATTCRILRGVSRPTDTSSRRSRKNPPLQAQSFLCEHKAVVLAIGQGTMNCSRHFQKVKTPPRKSSRVLSSTTAGLCSKCVCFFYCFAMNINYYQVSTTCVQFLKIRFFFMLAFLNKTALYTQTLTILTGHSGDLTLILS